MGLHLHLHLHLHHFLTGIVVDKTIGQLLRVQVQIVWGQRVVKVGLHPHHLIHICKAHLC